MPQITQSATTTNGLSAARSRAMVSGMVATAARTTRMLSARLGAPGMPASGTDV
jgi:hypothetical protein